MLGKYLSDLEKEDKKLIIDVPTRWDSIYSMLCRFSELKEGIINCLTKILQEEQDKKKREKEANKNKISSMELSSSEWEFVEDLAQNLVMLKIFTDKMQGDDSYISTVIPMSQIILKKIDKK